MYVSCSTSIWLVAYQIFVRPTPQYPPVFSLVLCVAANSISMRWPCCYYPPLNFIMSGILSATLTAVIIASAPSRTSVEGSCPQKFFSTGKFWKVATHEIRTSFQGHLFIYPILKILFIHSAPCTGFRCSGILTTKHKSCRPQTMS